ncbi:hypothetical protein VP01_15359g1, partial [Puccinia sorghi]
PAGPSVVSPMDYNIMAKDNAHVPPTQPATNRPSLGLLLKTVLEDVNNRSGAVKVPAGLITVLLEMLLNNNTIDRLNASFDAKMSATTSPILAHLAEPQPVSNLLSLQDILPSNK